MNLFLPLFTYVGTYLHTCIYTVTLICVCTLKYKWMPISECRREERAEREAKGWKKRRSEPMAPPSDEDRLVTAKRVRYH